MRRQLLATSLIILLATTVRADERPNVMVILVDDLGYSDPGCYGGEIDTPHLNSLADNGLRFTQFYNTARCWPTRSALLTGYYAQQIRRDKFYHVGNRNQGNRGKRPVWAPLLPKLLKPAGYRSYHSGKWHLDGMPIAEGFDRSYYLADQGRFFNPKRHYEDDKQLPAVEKGSDYYGTTAIADHAIRALREHAGNHASQPFFHYVGFTAPHFPLHALPEDIAKYSETYDIGWNEIRAARWKRQQQIGLFDGTLSEVEPHVGPPYHFADDLETLGPGEVNRPLDWNTLNATQKAFQADKMSVHAAMVDRIDQETGRILNQLRAMNAFDNTLIMFLSDNGGSAEIMVRDDGHDPQASPGSAETYLCMGPGWSNAANTPFRRHKTWVHEGGCCTPMIAHWPNGITDRGTICRTVGHVVDLVPTIVSLAGAQLPSTIESTAVPAKPGRSLVEALKRNVPVQRDSLWWSHEQNRALRIGDWKAVVAKMDDEWELFNLATDRTESNNLADSHADRLKRMQKRWTQLRDEFYELSIRD